MGCMGDNNGRMRMTNIWGDEDNKWMDAGTRTVNRWGGQGQHRGDNNGDGLTCQTCSTCKV